MNICFATANDIDSWMSIVDKVKDLFPGLDLTEHRATVLEFISRNEAICAKEDNKIVGALLFSKSLNMLCFLAVDPYYRRKHIAENMFSLALNEFDPSRDITVTTYREGVSEGVAARLFYKSMGFIEGKLTEEFNTPLQEFVYLKTKV